MVRRSLRRVAWMLATLMTLGACQSAYYGTLERLGIEKRDILVTRVEQARSSQQDAQQEFRSALEQFQAVVDYDGGELEDQYDRLSGAYEDARDQAEDVQVRVEAVDDVGRALFREWEGELDQYEDAALRRQSAQQLEDTQTSFDSLLQAMNAATSRMAPVLEVFEDQVLYLKHNLNARAIASLEAERSRIEARVEDLIAEMEAAIKEADRFIATMS